MPGSGKDTCAQYLSDNYGYLIIDLGEVVKEIAKKTGQKISRNILLKLGKDIRLTEGGSAIVRKAVENWIPWVEGYVLDITGEYKKTEELKYVINGIRGLEEVKYLQERFGEKFILIAIVCPKPKRLEYILSRQRIEDSTEFNLEKVDLMEIDIGGSDSIALADYYINNDSTLQEFYKNIDSLFKGLLLKNI